MPSTDSINSRGKKSKSYNTGQPAQRETATQKTSGSNRGKKNLMWLIVGVLISLIFLGWFFLFSRGLFSPNSKTKGWDTIKEGFNDLLNIFKSGPDISTDKNANLSQEEKRIKELEKKVFPQFENTQK